MLGDEFPLCKHSSFRFFSCDGINYVANLLFLSIVESANNKYIYIYIYYGDGRESYAEKGKRAYQKRVLLQMFLALLLAFPFLPH